MGFWTATVIYSSSRIWRLGERLILSPVKGKSRGAALLPTQLFLITRPNDGCKEYLALVTYEWMSEWMWSIGGTVRTSDWRTRGKPVHCQYVYHKCNINYPGLEPSHLKWECGSQLPEPWQGLLGGLCLLKWVHLSWDWMIPFNHKPKQISFWTLWLVCEVHWHSNPKCSIPLS